jgi:hypothetical protein
MPSGFLDAQVDPARTLNIIYMFIYTYYESLGGRTNEGGAAFFRFFLQKVLDFEHSSLAALGSGSGRGHG